MLEVLGLGASAESVYRGLLEHPGAGVAELCELLGMPETEVRDGLDRLIDLELLQPSRDVPGLLRALTPDVGLELILRRQEAELVRRQQELAAGKEAMARAVASFSGLRAGTEVDGAERLMGLDAIQRRLETLARDLRHECLAIQPGAQSQASLDASRPLDQDALARGISLRVIHQDSARNDPPTRAYARWITELGGEIRTSPVVPPRMLIFDRTTALVPIDPANSRLGALCTSTPGIVSSLIALFEQTWEAAVPLGADTRARGDEDGPSPAELELLKLLASGLTDEAAGKRLGVSLRTVRRQMSALMERLDAGSRFEAGLKAAQRGWL
ncbi:LuxR C-terminal-related transcriptional regulator [Streptomyces sp. NPDC086023]|uniref:LuxR C-terminal-related transcriptional regulator n=1 Tax=Streptomyces sp. NPDC086023 TaxID=3365746 RepID=UPI0037CEAA7D